MNKYFKNVNTLAELRSQYKKLLKMYHPDNNSGSEEVTKEINIEYEQLFKQLKAKHTADQQNANATGPQSSYSKNMYDWENDKALREILAKIINFNGIEIEIIGQWIWVFNSYNYRKELKSLGFKYAGQKKAWYFHTEAFQKSSHKKLSINDIRNYYGSTKVETNTMQLLEA